MRKIKTIVLQATALSLISLFTLSSCGSAPEKEVKEVPEKKVEKKETEAENIKNCQENFISFNGSDAQEGKLTSFTNDSYVIDFMFRMKVDEADIQYENSETTPPMLGYMMPWAFYQNQSSKLKITIKDDISYGFNVKDMRWYRVQIISNKENNTTNFIVDGKEMRSFDHFIPLKKAYIIGKGFKQRFWKGDLGYFRIYNYNELNKFQEHIF